MRIGRIVGMVAWCLLAVVAFVTAQGGRMEFAGVDITGTGATALDVSGGIQAGSGNVTIADAAGKIPEAAIDDDGVLARKADTETITGQWTFGGAFTRGVVISRSGADAGMQIGSSGGSGTAFGLIADTSGSFTIQHDADADPKIVLNGTAITMGATGGFSFESGPINSNVSQPGFLAVNASVSGTSGTIAWGTEVYDNASNFAAGTFTAPVTGTYLLCYNFTVDVTGITSGGVQLVTSNREYELPWTITNADDEAALSGCVMADMDASDTAAITFNVVGADFSLGTVTSGSTNHSTWFSGRLMP